MLNDLFGSALQGLQQMTGSNAGPNCAFVVAQQLGLQQLATSIVLASIEAGAENILTAEKSVEMAKAIISLSKKEYEEDFKEAKEKDKIIIKKMKEQQADQRKKMNALRQSMPHPNSNQNYPHGYADPAIGGYINAGVDMTALDTDDEDKG